MTLEKAIKIVEQVRDKKQEMALQDANTGWLFNDDVRTALDTVMEHAKQKGDK